MSEMTPTKWWSTIATLASSGTAAPYIAEQLGLPRELQGVAIAALAAGPTTILHTVIHGPLAKLFILSRLNARRRQAALVAAYVLKAMKDEQQRQAAKVISDETDPVVPIGSDRS